MARQKQKFSKEFKREVRLLRDNGKSINKSRARRSACGKSINQVARELGIVL